MRGREIYIFALLVKSRGGGPRRESHKLTSPQLLWQDAPVQGKSHTPWVTSFANLQRVQGSGGEVGPRIGTAWAITVVFQSLSHVQLCDPTDCSTPGFPVLHCLPELAQTHVHWVGDAHQPSPPLSSPSPPAPNLYLASGSFPVSQLFTSDGQSFGASASASVLLMNIQGWFPLGLTGLISLYSKGLSRVFTSTTVVEPKGNLERI